jgi:hypothetical protein
MKRGLSLLTLLAILPAGAHAQGDVEHAGAWGMFSLGAGSAGTDCGFCSDNRQWGPSGQFAFGGTMSRQFLLGVSINGFAHIQDEDNIYLGWVLGATRYYPSRSLGAYLSGGAGVNYGRGTTSSDTFDALGAGFLAGVGWDVGLGPSLAITVAANALLSAGGYLKQNGVEATNSTFSPSLFQFVLGLTVF